MRGSYRLRDGIGDWKAMSAFLSMVLCAAALGVFPAFEADHGALVLAYVAFFTGLLLVNMYTTDRRLREVSAE